MKVSRTLFAWLYRIQERRRRRELKRLTEGARMQ